VFGNIEERFATGRIPSHYKNLISLTKVEDFLRFWTRDFAVVGDHAKTLQVCTEVNLYTEIYAKLLRAS